MAKDAYSWYETQLEGLGESFLDELDAGHEKILANPSYYSFLENGFKRMLLKRFPLYYHLRNTWQNSSCLCNLSYE